MQTEALSMPTPDISERAPVYRTPVAFERSTEVAVRLPARNIPREPNTSMRWS